MILGCVVYGDYGISWDEGAEYNTGIINYNYIFHDDNTLLTYKDRFYGVAFLLPLVMVEKVFNISDTRTIFFTRHFLTFLTFYFACIFFYRICLNHFASWKMGLFAVFCLIATPRIFAHSFYNSKDMVFLSFFIISIYTLLEFLKKPNVKTTFLHAAASAFLIGVRVPGVIILFFTAFWVIFELFDKKQWGERKKRVLLFFLYGVLLSIIMVTFWPILWEDPVDRFFTAFEFFKNFQRQFRGDMEGVSILYLGESIKMTQIPWHYIPVWIGITTPLPYTILFLVGLVAMGGSIFQNGSILGSMKRKSQCLFLAWFLAPVFAVIACNSSLYDAWRHLFFIYPAFVIIAAHGAFFATEMGALYFRSRTTQSINAIFFSVFFVCVLPVIHFMIEYHPNQNVYFNQLAGSNYGELRKAFEMDYWGLSYRQGLEYIVKNDQREIIKVVGANAPGIFNKQILPSKERERIHFVTDASEADYFISAYRFHPEEYPFKNEVFSVKIEGDKILVVYKKEA